MEIWNPIAPDYRDRFYIWDVRIAQKERRCYRCEGKIAKDEPCMKELMCSPVCLRCVARRIFPFIGPLWIDDDWSFFSPTADEPIHIPTEKQVVFALDFLMERWNKQNQKRKQAIGARPHGKDLYRSNGRGIDHEQRRGKTIL